MSGLNRSDAHSGIPAGKKSVFVLDNWKQYLGLAAADTCRNQTEARNFRRAESLIRRCAAEPEVMPAVPSAQNPLNNAVRDSICIARLQIQNENNELLFSEMQQLRDMTEQESAALMRWMRLWILLAGFVSISALVLVFLYRRQRQKSEKELDDLYAVLEFTRNPIQIVGSTGTIQYANSAFYQWSGSDPSNKEHELSLKTMYLNTNGKKSPIWEAAKPVLQESKPWSGEILCRRPDGRTAVADILITPIISHRGKASEYIVFYTDSTEKSEFAQKIIETQKLYKDIVEESLDGILVVRNNVPLFANPMAAHILEYESVEALQRLSSLELFRFAESGAISSEQIMSNDRLLRNIEVRCRTKKENIVDIEINTMPASLEGQPVVLISFRNITEKKILERERTLWAWEQEKLSEIDKYLLGVVDLKKILDAIVDRTMKLLKSEFAGILLYDSESSALCWKSLKGNIHEFSGDWIETNPALKTLLDRKEMSILGREEKGGNPSLSAVPELSREKIAEAVLFPLSVEKKLHGFLIVGFLSEHDFSVRDKRLLNSLAEKSSIAMVNARLYDDLLEHEKELEMLDGARVQAQEEERRRIAREIHDGLGQLLTAVKFNLEILEDAITVEPDEQIRIDDMKKLLDDVMKEARELSYNLMPSVLEDFGLIPAVQLLCEQFSQRTGVRVQFLPHGNPERLPADLEVGIYRIAQEALTNIQKHAAASDVEVQIIASEHALRMIIQDNGNGFTIGKINRQGGRKSGMGLVSMRERTGLLKGTFSIESAPQHGTLICVEIPIKEEEKEL
jgi:signal transduction histidine kinase/PAS domain-containing protein